MEVARDRTQLDVQNGNMNWQRRNLTTNWQQKGKVKGQNIYIFHLLTL